MEFSGVIEKRLADLELVCRTLEAKHKNMFANILEADFLAKKQEIIAKIPQMSDADFFFALKELVATLKDAHTDIFFQPNSTTLLNFQMISTNIAYFEELFYLFSSDEENASFIGGEVIAINGIDIRDVFEQMKSLFSFENEAMAINNFLYYIRFKNALKYIGIVNQTENVIFTLLKNGITTDVELKSYDFPYNPTFNLKTEKSNDTGMLGYYRSLSLNEDTFYIQYNVCVEDPNLPMSEFVENIISEIKQNCYKKVIIDMRYNGGGSSLVIRPLLFALANIQQQQNITFYTAIARNTFSSGILAAIDSINILNAILVGKSTSGGVNCFGEVQSINLTNYPYVLCYSTEHFTSIPKYLGDALYPDIEVDQSFEDFCRGIDTVIEWIIGNEYIKPTPTKGEILLAGQSYRLPNYLPNVLSTESLKVNGKNYQSSYFGEQDISMLGYRYKSRKFYRLEGAYNDFRNAKSIGVVPCYEYPMLVTPNEVYVIDNILSDNTINRLYYIVNNDGVYTTQVEF